MKNLQLYILLSLGWIILCSIGLHSLISHFVHTLWLSIPITIVTLILSVYFGYQLINKSQQK